MNKNTLLLLSIATFITVVAWIGFNVYHNLTSSTISETESLEIAPLETTFNQQTIQSLSERQKVEPIFQLSSQQEEPTATQTGLFISPTPPIEQQATQSAFFPNP